MSKSCAHCTKELPTSSFYNNKAYPDGLDHDCKTCRMEANAKTPKRKREEEESEDPDVGEGDALYVLHNSITPHQFKVGRSKDPERRRLDMQRAQNFTVTLDAVFPALLPPARRFERYRRCRLGSSSLHGVDCGGASR